MTGLTRATEIFVSKEIRVDQILVFIDLKAVLRFKYMHMIEPKQGAQLRLHT